MRLPSANKNGLMGVPEPGVISSQPWSRHLRRTAATPFPVARKQSVCSASDERTPKNCIKSCLIPNMLVVFLRKTTIFRVLFVFSFDNFVKIIEDTISYLTRHEPSVIRELTEGEVGGLRPREGWRV